MNDTKVGSIHWSFWAISIVMLVWNALGAINFFVQMNPEVVEAYRETERAIIQGRPIWATVAFAFAVLGGTTGCLALLLRKASAFYIFLASLLGVILTMIHALNLGIDFGLGEILGIVLMPLIVAGFLVWYSKLAQAKAWIT